MPRILKQTRKHTRRVTRRRTTHHVRRRVVKGGGRLDRLPVGPGSRKADGTPEKGLESAANLEKSRQGVQKRLDLIFKPETRVGTPFTANDRLATHIQKTLELLPRNTMRTLYPLKDYESTHAGAISLVPPAYMGLKMPDLNESISEKVRDDFATNWEFFYACGHGVLAPHLPPAKVPERTYIRFNSPAGCRAVVSGQKTGMVPIMAFSDIFVQTKEAFLNDMTTAYFTNTGPLESFSDLSERAGISMNPYNSSYCMTPTNIMSESTESTCLEPVQKKSTFYGPGETIPQMNISFKNNPYEILMLGVYEMPITPAFYEFVQTNANVYAKRKPTKRYEDMTREEIGRLVSDQNHIDLSLFAADTFALEDDDGIHRYTNPNKAKALIGHKVTLTDMFRTMPPVAAGKVRFLFINSCRGVPFGVEDTGLAHNVAGASSSSASGSAASGGAASGGSGTATAATISLRPEQRQSLAMSLRRESAGNLKYSGTSDKLAKLVEARKYLKAHTGDTSNSKYLEMKAIDDGALSSDPELWSIAVSIVP